MKDWKNEVDLHLVRPVPKWTALNQTDRQQVDLGQVKPLHPNWMSDLNLQVVPYPYPA
uniref:Uncharacterized protein n=1 Tax=Cyanothece sp. (strain PCC 7425 / ATCC 29141) TaxID=395961 RepID=B8HX67_CYAP4